MALIKLARCSTFQLLLSTAQFNWHEAMATPTPSLETCPAPATVRYTVFTRRQRWYIVFLIAGAGWFSTLSSFIYYPILSVLADDLHTTIARINFTVTAYLAVSGLAPSIAGDAADMFGRRPVYMVTLSLYLCANIGIAVQNSFLALLLLRMLQSAGISGNYMSVYAEPFVQLTESRHFLGRIWRNCRHSDTCRKRRICGCFVLRVS